MDESLPTTTATAVPQTITEGMETDTAMDASSVEPTAGPGESEAVVMEAEPISTVKKEEANTNTTGMIARSVGYKGKALRSWHQLPPEVIRLIATFHLVIIDANSPLPATWDVSTPASRSGSRSTSATREEGRDGRQEGRMPRYVPWHEHMVYVAARDTREMEVLMSVCPQWGLAIEHHTFWNSAISLFDPHNAYGHLAWAAAHLPPSSNNNNSSGGAGALAAATRVAPYRHFRALMNYSCLPCRVNAPRSSTGLGAARRQIGTLRLGTVLICREHGHGLGERDRERDRDRERTRSKLRWCGVCLVDGDLARRAKAEVARMAREELARAESALAHARWHAANVAAAHGHGAGAGAGTGTGAGGNTNAAGMLPGMGISGLAMGVTMGMGVGAAQALVEAARTAAEQAHARAQRAEDDAYAYAYGTGGHASYASYNQHAYGRTPGMLSLGLGDAAGVVENEDENVFPGVIATCRSCRAEWLWRYALLSARVVRDPVGVSMGLPMGNGDFLDMSPAGGPEDERDLLLLHTLGISPSYPGVFRPEDNVVKGAVSAFVELGEGSVHHVLVIAGERGWLKAQTRWSDMLRQAMAAKRWGAGEPTNAREQQQRLRSRARSASPESINPDRAATKKDAAEDQRYTNNAANAAAYARAGYTTSMTDDMYMYEEEDYDEEDSELDDDEFEDEEEDEVAVALEMTVKEMALGDWARGKILDGAWVAPADVFYGGKVAGMGNPETAVRAVHPVSWSISPPSSPPHSASASLAALPSSTAGPTPPQRHPGPPTPPPPTYALAEAAHHAYTKTMRLILLPALNNVVRRIVIDCALDAADPDADVAGGLSAARKPLEPAMRAARMTLADVVAQLREEEGLWFDGMDWGAKRRNARAQEREDEERDRERHRAEGSDDSSVGTPRTSDTSPVLSTSTLGTTPSPPPLGERKEKAVRVDIEEREREVKPTIPVSPVLNPPRLLRPIPYIPETIVHLPPYSLEAIRSVWREACAPLYHCRCTVCERAMAAQQGSTTKNASATIAPAPLPAKEQPHAHEKDAEGPLVVHIPSEDDGTAPGADSVVKLVEDDSGVYNRDRDGSDKGLEGLTPEELYWLQVEEQKGPGAWEPEMELVDEMADGKWRRDGAGDGVDSEGLDGEEYEDEEGDGAFALLPAPAAWNTGTGRKRSVEELDGDEVHSYHSREGTPPKRARTGERVVSPSSPRLPKRGSDSAELDDVDERYRDGDTETESESGVSAAKRARREDDAGSPPDSMSTPGTTTASISDTDSYDPDRPVVRHTTALTSK